MVWTFKDIFIDIFKLLSVILILVFVLGKLASFRRMFYKKPAPAETAILIAFFGTLGILGTYGHPLPDVIANTRAVGIIVGGLVAGPAVGFGAGLVAGVHRYLLGGLTAEAAMISVILQGFLAGKYFAFVKRRITWVEGIVVGALLEILHFAIVLAISRPFPEALKATTLIAPPMIVVNSIGVAFFLLMLDTVVGEEKISADFNAGLARRQDREKKTLVLRQNEKVVIVNQSDIFFVKAIGQKKTEVCARKGNYVTNLSLKDLQAKLDPERFLRTHKSYIVNSEKITEVIPWFGNTYLLVMEGCGEKDIPVSRYYLKDFNAQMGIVAK
jgi:LytS/YehU family sensor histidine kinase